MGTANFNNQNLHTGERIMINLSYRKNSKEYIDDPQLDTRILRQTYQELKIINIGALGYWPTMSVVEYFLTRCGRDRVIRILDNGSHD